MLDLAFAVQASAGITDRDVLSHQLGAYSEHVRDLCLIIAKIYVKGMASFPLTLQMVSLLDEFLRWDSSMERFTVSHG